MFFFKVQLRYNTTIYTIFSNIFGFGFYKIKKFIAFTGLNIFKNIQIFKLNLKLLKKIEYFFNYEKYCIEFHLYRKEFYNIKNLILLHTYRGFCHKNGLPIYKQRTHTNANTQFKLYKNRLKFKK
jgi:small subunit ribosomal protein S13